AEVGHGADDVAAGRERHEIDRGGIQAVQHDHVVDVQRVAGVAAVDHLRPAGRDGGDAVADVDRVQARSGEEAQPAGDGVVVEGHGVGPVADIDGDAGGDRQVAQVDDVVAEPAAAPPPPGDV